MSGMIGILDVSEPSRDLLLNIAAGAHGQMSWCPHPFKEWYTDDYGPMWREHEDAPVFVWMTANGQRRWPVSLPTLACLRELQALGLVTREDQRLQFRQPIMLQSAGKTLINWLHSDGWTPHASAGYAPGGGYLRDKEVAQ